jgi:hypothetical protein
MSLVELLVATGLLLGSSAASMGLSSRVAATLVEDRQKLGQHERLEAEVQAVEARLLTTPQEPFSQQLSCGERLRMLVAQLESQPPQAGVLRSLEVPEGTEELLIRLRSGDQERRRLYSPAAFGGCGEAPAAPASGDSALAMAGGEGQGEGHGAI